MHGFKEPRCKKDYPKMHIHCIPCCCSFIIKNHSSLIFVNSLSFFFHALQCLVNLTEGEKNENELLDVSCNSWTSQTRSYKKQNKQVATVKHWPKQVTKIHAKYLHIHQLYKAKLMCVSSFYPQPWMIGQEHPEDLNYELETIPTNCD